MTYDARPSFPDPRRGAPPVPAGCGSEPDLAAAWRELVRVHGLEQARLLRDASRLRRRADRGAFRAGPGGCASDAELRLARWRRRVEEALELALADGLEPPAVLRFGVAHPILRWPSAEELARASLELEDCAAGRRLAAGGAAGSERAV